MAFTFTVIDDSANQRKSVSADTRVEALRLVAEEMLYRTDANGRDRRAIEAAIADGQVRCEGYKAPATIWREDDPEGFWMQVASHLITDEMNFCEGERADWEEGE